MTVLERTPKNVNFLQPNKFQLNFSRLPNMQYFCQSVNIPGVSLAEVPRNTPFVDIYSPGEKLIYEILNVTFIVDEHLQSWIELHDWMRAMTFPTEFEEYKDLSKLSKFSNKAMPQFSDGQLTVLSNQNTPTFRFKFVDCFPISISSIVFSSTDSPETVMTADASFRFSYYDIDKVI